MAQGETLARLPIRVLVAEDYEPFRRFLVSLLQNKWGAQVQDIREVSDGLEAVQEAQRLQPDLILLDIGLPTLNGIEAARRIRKVSPESKIIFVTQESSADIVQEALNIGACGYVVKTEVGKLLPALTAVFQCICEQHSVVHSRRSGNVPPLNSASRARPSAARSRPRRHC